MRSILGITTAAMLSLPFQAHADPSKCDAGEEVLKFSIVNALKNHPKGEAAMAFAERMNAEFDGRFCVEVYGNSELYDDVDVFPRLLSGEVTFAAPAFAKFGDFTDQFDIFNMPFLFDGPLHVMEFLDTEAAQNMSASIEDDGFTALAYWSNGMRQMSATVPIRGPQDASGLTFRVSSGSRITADVLSLMGITPKKLGFSKVYGALESGEVQGQENTWANIHSKRFHTQQAAVTETNHTYIGYVFTTSQAFMNGLDQETREKIEFISLLTTHERNRFAFELNQMRRQFILEEGGEIITLSPEEVQVWRNALKPIFDKHIDFVGRELVNAAVETNANTNPFGAREDVVQEIND